MTKGNNWDRVVPAMSEDTLLLAESDHRVRNELASAIAAMQLIRSAKGSRSRWQLLERAITRLEGFGELHGQLSVRSSKVMDVGEELDRLCRSLAAARFTVGGAVLDLNLQSLTIDTVTGRRLLLIANELVTNAIRHAMEDRAGLLCVKLDVFGQNVTLTVSDDGPGMDFSAAPKGSGMGTSLVGELVHRAGGMVLRESGPAGTRIQVCLPFDPFTMERAQAA